MANIVKYAFTLLLQLSIISLATTQTLETTGYVTTTPVTTPPVCMVWGFPMMHLRPGESKTDGCDYCYCDLNGRAQCARMMCTVVPCDNPVLPPGACCPVCFDISTTMTTVMTTITPAACFLDDGTLLRPGEQIINKMSGSCQILSCHNFMLETIYGDCIPAMCVDVQESDCCQYCPNGQNCRLPNGSLLYGSNPQVIDGMLCQCPRQSYQFGVQTEQHITAVCKTTLSTTTGNLIAKK